MIYTLFTCCQSPQPYKTSQGSDSMHGTISQEEGANQVTYIQRLNCRHTVYLALFINITPSSQSWAFLSLIDNTPEFYYSHQKQLLNFVTVISFKTQNTTRTGNRIQTLQLLAILQAAIHKVGLIIFSLWGMSWRSNLKIVSFNTVKIKKTLLFKIISFSW